MITEQPTGEKGREKEVGEGIVKTFLLSFKWIKNKTQWPAGTGGSSL
jgi:hypothetical protein